MPYIDVDSKNIYYEGYGNKILMPLYIFMAVPGKVA